MQWTKLLPSMMAESFATADKMMRLVSDDELNWKPATGNNWMTLGQLLNHMTNSCGWCCNGFATGDWSMPGAEQADTLPTAEKLPTTDSVASARELLAKDLKLALSVVEKAGEERLVSEMSCAPWEPDNSHSLGVHCLSMVRHLDSHRHQLFYYLKLMGKDVNTMTLWGM